MNNNIDLFGLSLPQLRAIVAEGIKGGDWCDLYFEQTVYNDLLLRDGAVASGGFHLDYGCGVRVLSGEKTGYAYSESTDFQSLIDAARAAGAIAGKSGSVKIEAAPTAPPPPSRPLASVTVTAIFKQGDATEQRNVSRSFRRGREMLDDALIGTLADEAVKDLDDSFAARRPKGGQMSVVMAAGASGILLHEAMGHAFEADFNRKGQSIFCDRMGKRICKEGINIIDDGTVPFNRGALLYDDEGTPSQKTYMVRNGVLTSYLHDRISAAWYGVAPTGNGRRESFRYNPIPRMRCTYMESGADGTLQDLISEVKKGVYVDKFANGEVKIGEGDFTFYVNRGYLIENGRLTMPVKDINIIGNGPRALADIVAVAGDLKIDDGTWTCGKEQSVAVSCGIPSVLINNLTVGGE